MTLDEILTRIGGLPGEDRKELDAVLIAKTSDRYFIPNIGPQTEAYVSDADEVFYGGGAGGGKSALLCGLAIEDHGKSIIFRREYPQIKGLVDDAAGFCLLRVLLGSSRIKAEGTDAPKTARDDDEDFNICLGTGCIGQLRDSAPARQARLAPHRLCAFPRPAGEESEAGKTTEAETAQAVSSDFVVRHFVMAGAHSSLRRLRGQSWPGWWPNDPGCCLIRTLAHKPDGWRPEPVTAARPDQTHPSAAAAVVP